MQALNTLQRYCCALLSLRFNICTPSLLSSSKRGYSDMTNADANANKRRKQDDSQLNNFQGMPAAPVLIIPGYN